MSLSIPFQTESDDPSSFEAVSPRSIIEPDVRTAKLLFSSLTPPRFEPS
jgi:hypothetical protein